jgi:Holliday junction DNA helicase RuvA
MIASIRGHVAVKDNDSVVIVVGGIGLDVNASRIALEQCREGDEVELLTRLIVREDALTLYGFGSEPERDVFDVLIKISGIGPRLAITILSTLSIDNLRNAVASERVELLTRVPGIGKKTAQKVMIELKDKFPVGLEAIPAGEYEDVNADVMDALVSLGFSVIEAQSAIQSLPLDAPQETDARVLLALQYLSN